MSRQRYLTVEEAEALLNESDGDDGDFSGGSDDEYISEECASDEGYLYSEDSDFDDEEESNDVNELAVTSENTDPLFVSKDGVVWQPQPFQYQSGRLRNENVISLRPGTTTYAKARVNDVRDAFLLFFPPHIENIILKHSNEYGRVKFGENFTEIDSKLLQAYIGILILAGVYRSKNETTIDLFDSEYGRPVFRAIMPKKTFEYVNQIICFDDVISRRQQRSSDKFAPIRELFDKWSTSLANYYNPCESVTVGEQLLGFRGRCKFRQYMPSKPVKYGIKFWLLVCSSTCYIWKIQPYLGKAVGASSSEKKQGERVVLDLVDGLKCNNVTMDKFFSSYDLGQTLLSKGITMVGTMRKNKRSIPPKLLECKKMPLYQSTFAFTENTALVSYIGRKNKCTILQSTMHKSIEIGTSEEKLPSIIEYYNKTKGDVDTVDKMLSCYSCKRKTNRWPVAVFSNMIDISAFNALIIFKEVNPNWQANQETTIRRNFLRELGLSLAKPYMAARSGKARSAPSASLLVTATSENSPSTYSLSIQPKRSRSVPPQSKGRARCHMCYEENSSKKNNVYETICCFCEKAACKKQHIRNVCVKCIEEKLI